MISFDFQVEEEASDKDNQNCSNNGKRLTFLWSSGSYLGSSWTRVLTALLNGATHPAGRMGGSYSGRALFFYVHVRFRSHLGSMAFAPFFQNICLLWKRSRRPGAT